MNRSRIEWTNYTSNPIKSREIASGKTGWFCNKIAPECKNCYAETINLRFGNDLAFTKANITRQEFLLDRQELKKILNSKPKNGQNLVFLGDMTDIFHGFIKREYLDEVFAIILAARQWQFQILTKRMQLAYDYFQEAEPRILSLLSTLVESGIVACDDRIAYLCSRQSIFPIDNLWLGISAGTQDTADNSIYPLLLCKASKIRFISIEPLLSYCSLSDIACTDIGRVNALTGNFDLGGSTNNLDWAIIGGESGRGARPMHPWLAYSMIDQLKAAGIPVFFKQWGEWHPDQDSGSKDYSLIDRYRIDTRLGSKEGNIRLLQEGGSVVSGSNFILRKDKKSANPLVRGQLIREFPKY